MDEIMAPIKAEHKLPRLRWGYVFPQSLCIGFTTNPDEPGVTITHLVDGSHTTIATAADDTLPGIYWVTAAQTSGIILYRWREPATHISDSFVGRSGGRSEHDGYEKTRGWLAERESTLRGILNTQMPPWLIKRIVSASNKTVAADAIHAISNLQVQYGDKVALQRAIRQLSQLAHNNITEARKTLPGYEKYDDRLFQKLLSGMAVIADSLP